MSEARQALVAWEQHLEEVVGVAHSARIVDRLDEVVTPQLLEVTVQRIRMERQADLGVLRSEMADHRGGLVGEMADLRGELRGEMADLRSELRGDMAELRAELHADMAELRAELHAGMAELRLNLRTEVAEVRQDLADRIDRLATAWRRDLLLVTGAQFTALAGAVLVLA